MRLPTVLVLLVTLLAAGCRDEPEPAPPPPAPEAPTAEEREATLPQDPVDVDADRPDEPLPEEAAPEREVEAERLFTVQVAAFRSAESARLWTDRLGDQDFPVWTSVAEVGGQTFHRVRVGAVPSAAEARQLGQMLTRRYQWPVWIAPVTPADRPPSGAVEGTRRLIGSG